MFAPERNQKRDRGGDEQGTGNRFAIPAKRTTPAPGTPSFRLVESQDGAADYASFINPAAPLLGAAGKRKQAALWTASSLPCIDPEIPLSVEILRTSQDLGRIAKVLVEERVIPTDYWAGSLEETVRTGLVRYLDGLPGMFRMLPLSLAFTDNVKYAELGTYPYDPDGEFDDEEEYAPDTDPLAIVDPPQERYPGAFAFRIQAYTSLFAESCVTALERIRPGAGFAVLRILEDALAKTTGVIGPTYARDLIAYGYLRRSYRHEAPAGEDLTTGLFDQTVPAEAWNNKVDRDALLFDQIQNEGNPPSLRMLTEILGDGDATARRRRGKRLKEIFSVAIQLKTYMLILRSDEIYSDTTELEASGAECSARHPVMIRWNENDQIQRIFDDYHEYANENGCVIDEAYYFMFWPESEKSIRNAVRRLKTVSEICALSAQLLHMMKTWNKDDEQWESEQGTKMPVHATQRYQGDPDELSVPANSRVTDEMRGKETLSLTRAILIYEQERGGSSAMATIHDIYQATEESAPWLQPGRCLTQPVLDEMIRHMSGLPRRREIMPEGVLSLDGGRMTWWTPARRAPIFFGLNAPFNKEMNGQSVWHPPLVFQAVPGKLYIYALSEDRRPGSTTQLCRAPYFNVYEDGHMCNGNVVLPGVIQAVDLPVWENGFYRTEFTSSNTSPLVKAPLTHNQFWTDMSQETPTLLLPDCLVELDITLEGLVNR